MHDLLGVPCICSDDVHEHIIFLIDEHTVRGSFHLLNH